MTERIAQKQKLPPKKLFLCKYIKHECIYPHLRLLSFAFGLSLGSSSKVMKKWNEWWTNWTKTILKIKIIFIGAEIMAKNKRMQPMTAYVQKKNGERIRTKITKGKI